MARIGQRFVEGGADGLQVARGVCFLKNSLTLARAAVSADPVFHSATNSLSGKSLATSSEIA
jgi:hypothetical protein